MNLIQWIKCTICGVLYDNSGNSYPRPGMCEECYEKRKATLAAAGRL